MSKSEILEELPKLKADEGREIFERICEMEEWALLNGSEPSAEEKAMLDRELEEHRANPEAGSSWDEVEARLRKLRP
jgi:putative addiction module component (TIGR02574 family)